MSDTKVIIGDPSPELRDEVEETCAVIAVYATITSPEMREAAGLDLQRNKSVQARVEAERLKIAKPLTEASRGVNAFFKKFSEPLEAAEKIIKNAILKYDDAVRAAAREAWLEAARKADEEKARLREQAAAEAAQGNAQVAHAIETAATMVAPVPVQTPEPVKITGESTRVLWRAEVTDLRELCRAIGAGEASTECVLPNMPTLNSMARALKATFSVPGVKALDEKNLATRAA